MINNNEEVKSRFNESYNLAQQGKLFEAIEKVEQLIREYPHFLPALCFLGDLYLRAGSPMLAIDPLEKVVEAAPKMPDAQFLLGCALGRRAKFGRAIHHLTIADRLLPNNAEIIRNLGWMKCMSGYLKEGRTLLRRTIKLDPKNSLAYNDLGVSYMFSEDIDLDKAEHWIRRAMDIEPENKFIQQTWESFKELTAGLRKRNRGSAQSSAQISSR